MSYSIKTIAVFLVVIGQLQLEVRSGVFEGFGWLGKGAKNGAEGSGAARTGSRAGKEIQGADDLERVHIDPKTPDGAQRLRHETVPWTSPRAALRADGAMFPVVNRAGAITPQIETKAESCLITFLPNLFRRMKQYLLGAKSPKKTDIGFNVAPDKEEVHVPHSPWGFSRRLKETDEIEHGRLLSETFASLIEETPPLPLEELRDWAAAIREAFTTLPHPELEIRLHTELSNFLKLASKENPSLPVHQAVPDFKKLHEFLKDLRKGIAEF
ncbi:hypothetical protein O181_031711 [Austropuccinia psidii MF-1]|uniref:Uncharacterized protein n=1 Tax=Austropuccinia psidii MF-1 TaxID=1389203 RepID=A0A9Q3H5G3_9BASI|nr:hypothetical protein [Austropuccinia psidii MF-1]